MFSDQSSITKEYNFPQNTLRNIQPKTKTFTKLNKNQQKQKQFLKQIIQKEKQFKNNFYFKFQVIKRVSTFLGNLKLNVALQKPNLKIIQLQYLENESKKDQTSNLFQYENIWVIIFQIVFFILLIFNMWKDTYELVYPEISQNSQTQIITLIFYIIHILISLNTQLKNQKMQIITHRNIIIQYYLQQKVYIDVLIMISFILQTTPLDDNFIFNKVSRISSILLLKRFLQIYKKLENIMSTSTQSQMILSILDLFFKMFSVLHILSILLTIFSHGQKHFGIQETWIEGNDLNIQSDFEQYIAGWYWASTILSTVGFGDITPVNQAERAFFSFIQIFGCIMSGYFVNFIGAFFNLLGQSRKNHQKQMRKVNRYLQKQQLPANLKTNIRSHFFNKYKIQEVYDSKTQQNILKNLSDNLSLQFVQTRTFKAIHSINLLKNFSQRTIKKLSIVAKRVVIAPQQVLFTDKSLQKKLWVIQDGIIQQIPTFFKSQYDKSIAIYDNRNQKSLGWINFLTDKAYRTTARSKTFSICNEINQNDFFRIVRQNQKDYNKIHQLRQIMIEKKHQFINKCLSCKKFTHNVINCPRIHFTSKGMSHVLTMYKKKKLFPEQQNRKRNFNRRQSRFNWKVYQNFMQQIQQLIQNQIYQQNIYQQVTNDNNRRSSIQNFSYLLDTIKMSEKDLSSSIPKIFRSNVDVSKESIEFIEKTDVNQFDKVYLGDNNGYFQRQNFIEINKQYVLYIIKKNTNKNKI